MAISLVKIPMNWQLFRVTEFSHHQDAWQQLNLSGPASPLFNPLFIAPLLREFGTGKELLAIYGKTNRPRAMAIITPKRRSLWETFNPPNAPLGLWIHTPDLKLEPLLSSLLQVLPGFPLAIDITGQDPDLVPRPIEGRHLSTIDHFESPRIVVQDKFETYWESRSKKFRQNLKWRRNRLQREGIATRLEITTSSADVLKAIEDYGRLESAGWKGKVGSAIHPDNVQGRFYKSLLEGFCRHGKGYIYRYWFNDRVAAMDLNIESNDVLINLKTTYNEDFREFSPAMQMHQELFKQVFDEGRIKKIEFYGKLMDWHTIWSDKTKILYHTNYYRWPVIRCIRRLHQLSEREAKR
jgi:CelD/BcsL family acetyltransferase involved in cellulose biosynthesis